jgi:hypothetical protein
MKNPLSNSSLFATPESFEDLQRMIEQFSGSEKTVAYHVSMLTLNLCHKMVEERFEKISRQENAA